MITPGDLLAQGHPGSSHSPQVLEHQGNIQDLHQHLVGFLLALGFLDNIHLHQGLQGSSLPAPELLGSFLGSTHLKVLQDSCPEALLLTHLDHFPLALELHLGIIQMCLTQVVSQEEAMGCMDQVVQALSPLQLAPVLSLHSLLVASPQYPLDHGDHTQAAASLQPLAPSVLVLGQWVRMVAQLQEACW